MTYGEHKLINFQLLNRLVILETCQSFQLGQKGNNFKMCLCEKFQLKIRLCFYPTLGFFVCDKQIFSQNVRLEKQLLLFGKIYVALN